MNRVWLARIIGGVVILVLLLMLFSMQNRLAEMARSRGVEAQTGE